MIDFKQYPTPWKVFDSNLPDELGGVYAKNHLIVFRAMTIWHYDSSNWKQTLQGICDIVNASQSITSISKKKKYKK